VTAVVVMAVLLGVFVARPLLPGTVPLLALFAVLLLVGASWPVAAERRPPRATVVAALALGVAAFAAGRLLGGGRAPVPAHPGYVFAVTLAAVAEELFFRRFVYAVLRPGGAGLAVGGSAALFAVAHVTVYGWWVLPLDLAAGLVLAWQRWATGSWQVPALTHVAANLLVVL
jgi:membrane protease YdiL (CAAX protease family)